MKHVTFKTVALSKRKLQTFKVDQDTQFTHFHSPSHTAFVSFLFHPSLNCLLLESFVYLVLFFSTAHLIFLLPSCQSFQKTKSVGEKHSF